jgi:ribosomal protein S18 acetylase RimI-like enzyme
MTTIRLVRPSDEQVFQNIMNRYIEEYVTIEKIYPVHFDPRIGALYWGHIQKNPEKYVVPAAFVAGVMVGFGIGFVKTFDEFESAYYQGNMQGEVWEFFVDPAARKRTIGRQILEFMEREFLKRGCSDIVLTGIGVSNDDAQRLYQRLNYVPWNMKMYKKLGNGRGFK